MNLLKMLSRIFAVMAVTMFFASLSSAVCVGDRQTDWITTTSFYSNTDDVKANKPDYYVIDVTTPGILDLTLTDLDVSEDLTVALYADGDCGGAAIWSDSTSGVGTTISTSVTVISAGVYTLQLYGSDGGLETDYRINGTFIASTNPPVMGAIPNQFFEIGVPFTFSLVPYVAETEGHSITAYAMTGLPGWATLDTTTGMVTGTPDANGTHTINASAQDVDGWSNIETFLLDSTPLLAPIISDVPDQDIIKDQAYSFDLSPYVTSSTAVTYYVSGGSLPAGLTLDSATGIISGTATVVGTVTLQVYVEDSSGVASNTDDVTFAVTAAGAASDLDLLKISSTRLTEVGTTVTYSITIANTTSSVLTGVDITDVLQTFNYDLLTATVGTLVVPSPDVNITIIEDNTFSCTVTALDRIECTGGTIDKRSGPHGVPGLQRIYYSITTPLMPNPSYLLNTASVDGTSTDVNASVIAASGLGGYNPPTTPPIRADVIEGGIWTGTAAYNSGAIQVIQTKVAGENNVTLTAVHLDGESNATVYSPANSDQNFLVIPYMSDGLCGSQDVLLAQDGTPARFYIPSGQASADIVVKMPDYANKVRRIVVTYLDFDVIAPSGASSCVISSSSSGNLGGLPQCVNSEQVYYNTFGLEAYARCAANNGEPCTSTNGGYSCGPGDTSCTGYNPDYDNEYGCLMCTLNIQPECSSDNFALRPNEFDSTLDPAVTINASEPTTMTFSAFSADGATPTVGYNEVQPDSFDVTLDITDPLAVCPFTTFDLTPNVEFVNGTVTGDYTFDHVGEVTMKIAEIAGSEYALVDASDTLDEDRYITPWEENITIIPDHFKLEIKDYYDANYDLTTDKNFTYLSDDYKMMSMLEFNITAEDFLNNTTPNYTDLCAATDVNVTLTHSAVPPPLSNFVMRLDAKYVTALPVENKIIPVTDDITFTTGNAKELPKEFFLNGTASLELLLNFDRKTNQPLNPFVFTLNDITVVDENATTTDVSPEIIDKDATFFYARVHSPRSRAMCNGVTCNGTVNFYYEVYGKDTTAVEQGLITTLLGAVPKKSLDSVNWYRNTEHNLSSDGNVSGSTQNIPIFSGTPVSFTPNIVAATTIGNYNYDGANGYPFKGTVTVDSSVASGPDSNQTQPWLIYDQFNPHPATIKNVELEYYGPGTWSSDTGPAGSVTDTGGNKNRNTNRRIRW